MACAALTLPAAGAQPTGVNMGLGPLGTGSLIFKRKFRWTMEITYCDSEVSGPKCVAKEFVKLGSRPQIDIEETEINYLHGKMFIPGKATWQTMTVTYYDVAGSAGGGINVQSIFGWIASVYDITDPTKLYMGSKLSDYEGTARIYLYDGCGNAVEGWLLRHVWPQSVNFGELDMSSSEECTVELTLRYSEVQYQSYCPAGSIDKCPCTPCDSL